MTPLFAFFTSKLGRYVAIALALLAALAWLRWDAVQDFTDELRLRALESRIEVKEQADDRRNEIDALDDCELLRDSLSRLSGDAAFAERAFQRCREGAAQGAAGNGGLSGSE